MILSVLLNKLPAPARRAIEALNIGSMEALALHSRDRIAGLHGIGPNALRIIEGEMTRAGCAFKEETGATNGGKAVEIATIDRYIGTFPKEVQKKLEELRDAIKRNAPKAIEKISYQMPTFFYNGNLVYFAAYAHHIGFYPSPSGISAFERQLKKYKHAKGSVQFPLDKPLPIALIEKIVAYRYQENEENAQNGKGRKRTAKCNQTPNDVAK